MASLFFGQRQTGNSNREQGTGMPARTGVLSGIPCSNSPFEFPVFFARILSLCGPAHPLFPHFFPSIPTVAIVGK